LKKLAIVGTHSDTREHAPYNDPSYDIWVFNEAGNSEWCKRWTAVFQMHEPEIYKGHNTKDAKHWDWLQRKHGKPIYMQEIDPQVPDSVRYPIEDAEALSGELYFTSTLAYTVALAIMQKYERVEIYGIELNSNTEYSAQAECYRYWIGFLKGSIGHQNVILHSSRSLFQSIRYGYDGAFAFGKEYFQERVKVLDAEWTACEKSLQNIKKAFTKAVQAGDVEKSKTLVNDLQAASIKCGGLAGSLAEAERYAAFGDRYADRGGFEFAAAKAQRDGEAKRVEMLHAGGTIEYLWNAFATTKSESARAQFVHFVEDMLRKAYDMGAMHGIYTDNLSYIAKYDAMAQMNGGLK